MHRLIIRNHTALVVTISLLVLLASNSTWSREPSIHQSLPPGLFLYSFSDELELDHVILQQIKQIGKEATRKTRELMATLKEERLTLRALLAKESPNPEVVMAQAEKIGELTTNIRKIRLQAVLDMRNLLTQEQKATLVDIQQKIRSEQIY